MSHTIIYNSEERIIEIKVQGDFSLSEAKEMFAEAVQVVKAQNCFLVLNDMREATMKLSMVEIYKLPKTLAVKVDALGFSVHKLKRALVVKKDLKGYRFFEDVASNRAQSVKYFFDMNEARKWLLEN